MSRAQQLKEARGYHVRWQDTEHFHRKFPREVVLDSILQSFKKTKESLKNPHPQGWKKEGFWVSLP